MTREFKEAYRLTVLNEGYFSNNPNDRGGMTWKGIARNMHPDWIGWREIDKIFERGGKIVDIKTNAYIEGLVQDFYYKEFWLPLACDKLIKPNVRNKYFDTAVNVGQSAAIKFNQRSLGMPDTGRVTDEFIKRLNSLT